jgi:hypothetical protein
VLDQNQPPWEQLRLLSNALELAARVHLERDQPDDGAAKIRTGLAVATSLEQEPSLIAQLMRMAIVFEHSRMIQRVVSRGEPSRAALESLALALVDARAQDPLRVGLLAEVTLGNSVLARMELGRIEGIPDLAASASWAGPLARLGRSFVQLARARYLRQMRTLIDAHEGPRPRPSALAPPSRWDPAGRLAHTFIVGIERALDTGDHFRGAIAVAELGVALRRYRVDHGDYPDTLAALAPAYLAQIPIDPFTGQPPVYSRSGAGFSLKGDDGPGYAFRDGTLEWRVER